ncbi:MAG: DNA replication/repair protein RecF [Gammaproteobacteria bacterium]|nr:DNA replication/repair protein RecF [Gammaproteobacteria bacterium]
MYLSHLGIENVRILPAVSFEPSPGLNIITGENGSGKTSLLEAIHLIGHGYSFRSRKLKEVKSFDQPYLQVTAKKIDRKKQQAIFVGIRRDQHKTEVKADGSAINSLSELARIIPVRVFHPESYHLVSGSSRLRRQYLDWGVFHVEHRFIEAWKRYNQCLKQRNAALRQRSSSASAWDRELSQMAAFINRARRAYLEQLRTEIDGFVQRFLPGMSFDMVFINGWDESASLQDVLRENLSLDMKRGYTSLGAHRTDFQLKLDGHFAAEIVSRGQQKALVVALLLAQIKIKKEHTGEGCICLIDDLPSELDRYRQENLVSALDEMQTQVFITGIDQNAMGIKGNKNNKMFHVERGKLTELI